ncbi:unnamed protein product, partial [Sphacelaria rigidula]
KYHVYTLPSSPQWKNYFCENNEERHQRRPQDPLRDRRGSRTLPGCLSISTGDPFGAPSHRDARCREAQRAVRSGNGGLQPHAAPG